LSFFSSSTVVVSYLFLLTSVVHSEKSAASLREELCM
jgi:hypothetical protein